MLFNNFDLPQLVLHPKGIPSSSFFPPEEIYNWFQHLSSVLLMFPAMTAGHSQDKIHVLNT